jgi:UDPglucose--hexose-1-phosphate uridylyltransferase
MPTDHEPSYEQARSDDSWDRLAKVLRALVDGIESLVPSASFNMLLRTAPWHAKCDGWFHWRIELQPRMNAIAGLESATGIYINPVAPERAAAELRGKL